MGWGNPWISSAIYAKVKYFNVKRGILLYAVYVYIYRYKIVRHLYIVGLHLWLRGMKNSDRMNTRCRNALSLLNSLVTMPHVCRNSSFYTAVKSTIYCRMPKVVDAMSPSRPVGNFHVQNPPETELPTGSVDTVLHRINPFRIASIAFYHSNHIFKILKQKIQHTIKSSDITS